MPKLQKIKRANGSLVYSVNFPLEIIEELGWEKGQKLGVEIFSETDNEPLSIKIFKEDEKEENDGTQI